MIWRGAVEYPPFLTGRSMIIAGGMQAKLDVHFVNPVPVFFGRDNG
jgi:hypothetical protein